MMLGAFAAKAQDVKNDTIVQSLKETVDAHTEKFNGLDERLSEMSSDLSSLKKIKVSGYIQAQYDNYDYKDASGHHGMKVGTGNYVDYSFYIRRARVKFTYEAADGVKFVLCPDFSIDKFSMKDAYAQFNDRWLNTFSLWVGQFNKPNYDIEYSSANREFAERTMLARTLYPTERDQGAKLEANFENKYKLPLKLQFAVLNGNFGRGLISDQARDVDNVKDFMARAVYKLKMPSQGLGIDFGANGYLGKNEVLTPQTGTMPVFTDVNNKEFTPEKGDRLKHQWFGGEMQLYWDFLGGMSLKSEYIAGTFSTFSDKDFSSQSYKVSQGSNTNVNKVRNFDGYYFSLVKSAGKDHQFGVRYDVFDPNKKLSGNDISSAADLKYSNWTFSYQYFFDANCKIQLTYTLPVNEKSNNAGLVGTDYANIDKTDNTLTLRFQARF